MKRLLLVLLLTALAVLAAGAFWWRSAVAPAGSRDVDVVFTVAPGTSLRRLGRDLEAAGLVRNGHAFEWLGRARSAASQLRAGEYLLRDSWSAEEILDRVVAGRVRTYEVVLPEGLTAAEIAIRVEEAGLAEADAFLSVVRDPAAPDRFGVEGPGLEGYLFPETYQLARGLAVEQVVATLVDHYLGVWSEIAPAAKQRGLSMREVTILASIVERETGAVVERPLIASVFHNRIALGMRLETDPTVIYGIPDFDGNLTRAHLDDATNPYNTYQISGLPPGPIANPGAAALRAVVDPAEAKYLYFVSRNDGTHVFSRSYREHVNAVNHYQRRR
jgi:UPF0755 protein